MNSQRWGQARRVTRRQLMCGAAATCVLAPFIPVLEAEAQAKPLQRLVTWFTPNGTIHREWTPEGGVLDFKLKRILAPLEPYRDKLVVISGLKFTGEGPGNQHMQGPHLMFAGSNLNEGDFEGGGGASAGWGTSISIDQVFAQHVGDETAFRYFVLAVGPEGGNVRHRLSYAGDNEPLVPDVDPAVLFDRVFSTVTNDAEQLALLRLQKQSVIDLVKDDIATLKTKYGTLDQTKLEAHLESVRAIETRLARDAKQCELPVKGEVLDIDQNDAFPEIGKRMMDTLAAIFACDTSRTASLMWGGSTNNQKYPWLGVEGEHHELSHKDGEAPVQEELIKINTWYSEQLAYFMQKLSEIPELEGSALDHTLILAGNELGEGGRHSHKELPVLLAGGANGQLQMGRYLQAPDEANNRLLVSVLHAMGLTEHETFGNSDQGNGPLIGL
jgi:hypothetical protein